MLAKAKKKSHLNTKTHLEGAKKKWRCLLKQNTRQPMKETTDRGRYLPIENK